MFVSGGWNRSSGKSWDVMGYHGTRWFEAGWAASSQTKMRSSTLDKKFRVGKRGGTARQSGISGISGRSPFTSSRSIHTKTT